MRFHKPNKLNVMHTTFFERLSVEVYTANSIKVVFPKA